MRWMNDYIFSDVNEYIHSTNIILGYSIIIIILFLCSFFVFSQWVIFHRLSIYFKTTMPPTIKKCLQHLIYHKITQSILSTVHCNAFAFIIWIVRTKSKAKQKLWINKVRDIEWVKKKRKKSYFNQILHALPVYYYFDVFFKKCALCF